MGDVKSIELNEFLGQLNDGKDNPIVMPHEVLSNKFGDEPENQSDIRTLYEYRVRKIVTTFDFPDDPDFPNNEHYALQVKRKKDDTDNWVTMAWCDTEDEALEHLNQILNEKYPSWVERCVFGQQEHGCKDFKYLD